MISIFTTATRPHERGDMFDEAMACYNDLADEVIVTGEDWPQEFSWELIGQKMTEGYDKCCGDWAIKCDLDYLFHERDFGRIKQALKDYPNAPAVSFYKHQFILSDRYNLKSRLAIALNKKVFGNRLALSGGGDLCAVQLDNSDLDLNELPQAGVPFYNYEKLTKTKEQITDDVERMDRAYERRFGRKLYSTDEITAYEGWYHMVKGRFNKPQAKIKLEDHPKYVQETIKNLNPNQFGYNGFGLVEGKVYA